MEVNGGVKLAEVTESAKKKKEHTRVKLLSFARLKVTYSWVHVSAGVSRISQPQTECFHCQHCIRLVCPRQEGWGWVGGWWWLEGRCRGNFVMAEEWR